MDSFERGYGNVETEVKHPDKCELEADLHAALNPHICEPVQAERAVNQDVQQGAEVGFINPNTIIDREKSLSERLQGTARKASSI
jgi:hypothetical protein